MIPANKQGEQALTKEPLYQGEPILAVAAVDELTAAEAIEKIKIDFEPLPFVVDPLDTLRPGGPNPRVEGNVWVRPPALREARRSRRLPAAARRRAQVDRSGIRGRQARPFADGQGTDEWCFGDVDAGFKNAALVLDETFVTPEHQPPDASKRAPRWPTGRTARSYVHTGTQSTAQTVPAIARWLNIDPATVVFISEYTGGGFGSKVTGAISLVIPALLVEESQRPGHDAHQPRGRDITSAARGPAFKAG